MLIAAKKRHSGGPGAGLEGPGAGAAGAGGALTQLSFYRDQPNEDLTLEDFEILAFNRVKLLREVDALRSKGVKGSELNALVKKALKEHVGPVESHERSKAAKALRDDVVSHHILRLAYCSSEDKRKWFLAQEVALFRARFETLTAEQRAEFCAREKLRFTEATREELTQHAAALEDLWYLTNGRRGGRAAAEAAAGETTGASAPGAAAAEARPTDYRTAGARFFKVRFTDSVELLRNHSGYLVGGWLFIEAEDLKAIVAGRYRAYLSQCLAHAYKALPPLLRDERLAPVLDGVSKAYAGPQYGGEGGKPVDTITADDVDALATSAFPLCMQNLHAGLKAESHLRHGGRMQYGLFLKGVGLSLEDALVFWQREFTKKMTPEQFLKQYAYNIRHNYGKEGKRVDYTAYSCSKILNGPPPGAGEFHGCPYRHWDINQLRNQLGKMGLGGSSIEGVLESVRSRDFQVACRKQFEARYPGVVSGNVGNHPNAYVVEAQEYLKKKAAAEAGSGAGSGAAAASTAAAPAAAAAGFSASSSSAAAAGTAPPAASPTAAAAAGEGDA